MESEILKEHASLQRAIDIALWMNFKYRLDKRSFVIIQNKKTKHYQVISQKGTRKSLWIDHPENYFNMSYQHIASIGGQTSPLSHWEEIMGLFSSTHGELLRFIIAYKVPLEKIIRFELAARGHDKNHLWVGFEKAREIWLE